MRQAVTAYVFFDPKTKRWSKPYCACRWHRRSESAAMDWYPERKMGRAGVAGYTRWIELRRALGEKAAGDAWQKEVKKFLSDVLPPRGPAILRERGEEPSPYYDL